MLTFAELEALACFGTSGFLTFNSARVAGHESMLAQNGLVVGVHFDQGAGNCETQSFGLSFETAAVEVDVDVVFFGAVEHGERLLNDELKNRRGEIHFEGATVDGDLSVAFFEDYTGHGGFAAAY